MPDVSEHHTIRADELAFAEATAVTPQGDDRYEVHLPTTYAIRGTKPNGGFMLALLGRAAVHAVQERGSDHQHVISAGVQFLSSPDLGPATVTVEVLRVGRTASQARATLAQAGKPAVEARFVLSTLPEGTDPYWGGIAPPALPPIDDCIVATFTPGRSATIAFDPAARIEVGGADPVANGNGELRAWFVPEDVDAVDPARLLFVADCLPPPTFGIVQSGWVPTLDLTAYVRAVPEPGPLRIRFRAVMIQDGFVDEVLEAWDARDRLVLQATQVAAIRLPG